MINKFTRRQFLLFATAASSVRWQAGGSRVITVNGPIASDQMGRTLVHEHVLVDFIGADKTNMSRWDRTEVIEKVLPYLLEAKKAGIRTIAECTPAFLGRDPELLKALSEKSGVQLITNTGYYGAVGNKYLPPWAFTESAEALSARWTQEFNNGIESTGIKPGFIKISVDAPAAGLSDLHKKLVRAAALTHLQTGLTIYSHTGPANAAFEEIEILQKENVSPEALVWVHAQAEKDKNTYVSAARTGAWVSLDNVGDNTDEYITSLQLLRSAGLLHKVLLSHDAGYYRPGEPGGGPFTGYTNITEKLIPRLLDQKFTQQHIDQLFNKNPANALSVRVRRIQK